MTLISLNYFFQSIETHCGAKGFFLYTNDTKDKIEDFFIDTSNNADMTEFVKKLEPNTALLSAFLMIGTFIIAYQLRIFKTGHFLGRTVSLNLKS